MYDVDVLVIGAGPAGTALALELALHKVSFRVIDKNPVRSDKSKAFIVQARTLELLNRHGAAHEWIRRGNHVNGSMLYINRKPLTFINLEGCAPAEAEFPLPLMISQAKTEQFLDDCLAKHGRNVERGITAKSIVQDATGVTTVLELPDGKTQTVRSKYVVGCDGAHSIVRHSAKNVTFDGAAYPEDFALCDAYLHDTNLAQDRISMHLGVGLLAVIPLGNNFFRLVVSGGTSRAMTEAEKTEVNHQSEVTLDHFQSALERFTRPGHGTLEDPVWLTRFRLHHRGVNKYRDGRLFLAGDAAHIHSPAGGQGLNTGMQDGFNLGWKLAAVLHGRTPEPETLLDSYHVERRPVAQELLGKTDRLFTFISTSNWFYIRLRNLLLPWILPFIWDNQTRSRTAYMFLSELGVTYRKSAIVGTAAGFTSRVAGGDRLPDGELKKITEKKEEPLTRVHHICTGSAHHLIFFTGGGPGELPTADIKAKIAKAMEQIKSQMKKTDIKFKAIVSTADSSGIAQGALADSSYLDVNGVVHERYGFERTPGYVFTRPDGYIAHIGPLSSFDDLLGYLRKYFV